MRSPHAFLTTLLLTASVTVRAQIYEAAWTASGDTADQVSAVAINSEGDILAAFVFADDGVFNGNTLPYPGHIYLACISPDSVEWIAPAGISMEGYNEEPFEIVLDEADNIYLAGHFGTNTHVGDTTLNASTIYNTFVAKFSPQGDVLWAKPAAWGMVAVSIDRSISGELVVGGSTYGPNTVVGSDTLALLGDQGQDILLLKFNADGDLLWYDRSGGPGWYEDMCADAAFDPNGEIFMCGYFRSDANFDTIAIPDQFSVQTRNGFVAKYNAAGEALWVERMSHDPERLGTDASGNVYVVGTGSLWPYDSLLISGVPYAHHYLSKFNGAGDIEWIVAPNDGNFGFPRDVYTHADGRSWVVGHHQDSLSIGPYGNAAPGLNGLMIYEVDTDGNVLWMELEGNAGTTSDFRGYSIAHDNDCGLVIGGSYKMSEPWYEGGAMLPATSSTNSCVLRLDDCSIAMSDNDRVQHADLFLYPNPTEDVVHVRTSVEVPRSIQVVDAAGRFMPLQAEQEGPFTWELNMMDLPAGCYLVRIDAGTTVTSRIVLVQ
jgi:hypothetical protein